MSVSEKQMELILSNLFVFLFHTIVTWLILPVAYACLKD